MNHNISRENVNFDCIGLVPELVPVMPISEAVVAACIVMLPLPLKRTLISVMHASDA